MCAVAGLSFLFIVFAIWNLFHGDTENATAGFIAGSVLGVVAYALGREESEAQTFLGFLDENTQALREGSPVTYRDVPINLNTQVTQFLVCLSLIIFTTKVPSRFYIRGAHKTGGIGTVYSLVTFFCGWWGFPWGPIYTVQTFYVNMRGGDKKTIAQLLTAIETAKAEEAQQQAKKQPATTPATETAPAPLNISKDSKAKPDSPWS